MAAAFGSPKTRRNTPRSWNGSKAPRSSAPQIENGVAGTDSRVLRAGSSDQNLLRDGVRKRIVQRLLSASEAAGPIAFSKIGARARIFHAAAQREAAQL